MSILKVWGLYRSYVFSNWSTTYSILDRHGCKLQLDWCAREDICKVVILVLTSCLLIINHLIKMKITFLILFSNFLFHNHPSTWLYSLLYLIFWGICCVLLFFLRVLFVVRIFKFSFTCLFWSLLCFPFPFFFFCACSCQAFCFFYGVQSRQFQRRGSTSSSGTSLSTDLESGRLLGDDTE